MFTAAVTCTSLVLELELSGHFRERGQGFDCPSCHLVVPCGVCYNADYVRVCKNFSR